MNILPKIFLKIMRKLYEISNPYSSKFGLNPDILPMKEYSNKLIYNALISDKPIMVARLGSTEMLCLTNYLGVKGIKTSKNNINYIKGHTPPWWWEKSMILQMQSWSGFFPGTINKIEQFCELMLTDMKEVDILGSWLKDEFFFKDELSNSKKVMLEDLEPFFAQNPWTLALKGKKILVIHPFAETIQKQYLNRVKLFENNLLPEFELETIKAVQSIAGEKTQFSDWFEALNYMKIQISEKDFDICILGCGAYGLPLAAHIKRMGKKAVHLGGVTQLLFGINGKRWDHYHFYPYENLYNEFWVRPDDKEKPRNAQIVEGGCYW